MLVRRGGDRILFDCGEGTQRQLVSSVGLAELTEVFITHFHADHWLGLPGLLKTFDLRARERPLAIHGPAGVRELITLALRVAGRVRFPLELIELAPGDVLERDGYRIAQSWSSIVRPRSATSSTRTSVRACSIPTPPGASGSSPAPSSGACSAGRRSAASLPSR